MDTRAQLDIILGNTYTKSDLYHRLAVCKSFLEHWFYSEHADKSQTALLKEFLSEQKEDPRVIEALTQWGVAFYQAFTQDSLYDAMTRLEEASGQLPLLTLYIPTKLPPECIDELGKWVRTHVGAQVLMRIMIDPHTAGGCAFMWGGRYYDFSFSYFAHKRYKDIVDAVRTYGRTNGEQDT